MLRLVLRFHHRNLYVNCLNKSKLFINQQTSRFESTDRDSDSEPEKRFAKPIVYLLSTIAIFSGGTLIYAKYDPDFRKIVTKKIEVTDGIIKLIFQEEKTYRQSWINFLRAVKSKLIAWSVRSVPTERNLEETRTTVDLSSEDLTTKLNNIDEWEKEIGDTAVVVIHAFKDATVKSREHAKKIYQFVETSADSLDINIWKDLKDINLKAEQAVQLAEKKAKSVIKRLERMKALLNKSDVLVPEEARHSISSKITDLESDIELAKQRLDREKDNVTITKKYWKYVEEARQQFSDEFKILFPNINLSDYRLRLSGDEFDLFLIYVTRRVALYQNELCRIQTLFEQQLAELKDTATDDDVIREKVEMELERHRHALELQYQKKALQLKAEHAQNLRSTMKKLEDAHEEKIKSALGDKEKQLKKDLQRVVEEKLSEEQSNLQVQMGAMIGRLRGIEDALRSRADTDKRARQATELWSACRALQSSISCIEACIPWTERFRPLDPEVRAIRCAAQEDDELVTIVTDSLPPEVCSRGVYPEDALRERFLHVELAARRLSMIPEEGSSLPMYILSCLYSCVGSSNLVTIPDNELRDCPVNTEKLDTLAILQRARFWMDRGDLDRTLRYMNLLTGAPRMLADDWMNEARILLETRLAADTLMTYAAAECLANV